jgi:hypothetical protein
MVKRSTQFTFLLIISFLFIQNVQVLAQTTSKDTTKTEKDSVKVIIGRQASTLSGVTGFMKQSNDKWATAYNKIPFFEPDFNSPYYDKYKIGAENIQQISFYDVSVDGKPYYLLLNRYLKGYYKDEANLEGFRTYYAAEYYFVDKNDVRNAFPDSFKLSKSHTIMLRTYYSGYIPLGNMLDLQKKVNWDVNNNLKTAHLYDTTVKAYYCFITYPYHGKSGSYVKFSTALAYAQTGKLPQEPSSEVLKSQYYQTSLDKFKLLFRPK